MLEAYTFSKTTTNHYRYHYHLKSMHDFFPVSHGCRLPGVDVSPCAWPSVLTGIGNSAVTPQAWERVRELFAWEHAGQSRAFDLWSRVSAPSPANIGEIHKLKGLMLGFEGEQISNNRV